ncbi:glycosyltransferase [Polaribacter sp. PL03]|uniref:glycosyltransferase n=1 Tax=Polaribacter sp. PL03 TaxID=3088353 RepID=UPI0029CC91AD|nr:glycosyltransferase [Polaribacter sp. PL03]MDX6746602.1 glycosyltransferase [Polaribacter sp. PL03]
MKRVIVTVTNDLSTDQRVAKVCNTLTNNNFNVLLIGRKLNNSKKLNRNYKTKRFNLFFNSGFLFFAEYNFRLFLYLLFTKKDILLSNDLDTLLPNYLVGKILNKKIVFDSHELFPEIPELVNRPKVKKVWLALEKWMLPKLKNNYTVCNSIAQFYKEEYNSSFKTIMNLPTKKEIELGSFPFEKTTKKVILYQGAINIGRGLELIIAAMKFLENHILVIIGDGDIYKHLKKQNTLDQQSKNVVFLGKMAPNELYKLTPLADLGISLEEDLGLNYRFALPNKIFDYIQAEVPVLVSDLPEMSKIINKYNVGEIVVDRTPKKIAFQINQILNKDFTKELKLAKKELIWEKQEDKLLTIFNNLK